jgi:hypothetical protein
MANRKITDLTALTTPAAGDLLPIVDISEGAAADKNKKITYSDLISGVSSPPGGSTTQVQFNDGGVFGGDADLTWNKTTNVLGVTGDVNLSDGGTYTTTLQTITPTAARTISLPDATGTVALVAGSSGQLLYNNAGVNAGVSSSAIGATGNITLSLNGAASTPPLDVTGTWFTGGTSTTTKPQVLIEPTGATSTAWSTSGTGLGVNAASGFAGNLLDLQVNGTTKASFTTAGDLKAPRIRFNGANNWDTSYSGTTTSLNATVANTTTYHTNGSVFRFTSALGLGWSSGNPTGTSEDLVIRRDAANTLAQRNAANAQTSRVYNTYTSATSYERAKLEWSSNVLRIGTEKGSAGGTARDMELQTDGTTRITVKADGAILFSGVPTSNPAVAGQLWNDGGTLKISAG